MVNKKINVHNKGLLVLAIISVVMGTLLAGISNYYISRPTDCDLVCRYGFPLQSSLRIDRRLGNCVHGVCMDVDPEYLLSLQAEPVFDFKNFTINAAFYSFITFITFGILSVVRLAFKKQSHA